MIRNGTTTFRDRRSRVVMVVALCCMLVVMAFLGCLLMRIVLVLVRDCGAAAGQSLVGATGPWCGSCTVTG